MRSRRSWHGDGTRGTKESQPRQGRHIGIMSLLRSLVGGVAGGSTEMPRLAALGEMASQMPKPPLGAKSVIFGLYWLVFPQTTEVVSQNDLSPPGRRPRSFAKRNRSSPRRPRSPCKRTRSRGKRRRSSPLRPRSPGERRQADGGDRCFAGPSAARHRNGVSNFTAPCPRSIVVAPGAGR